jgi:hypothetical protein
MVKDDGATTAKPRDEDVDEDLDEEGLEGDKDEEEGVEEKPKEKVAVSRPAPRRAIARSVESKRDLGEVTSLGAFTTFFVFSSLILAPVLGIVLYFMRTSESVMSVFKTAEGTFLGGLAIGLLAAFVASLVFTYKAVQHS